MNKRQFLDTFYGTDMYYDGALKHIVRFDTVWTLQSRDGFCIILHYWTKNRDVWEAVVGTIAQNKLTSLRSIYDLAETKAAMKGS